MTQRLCSACSAPLRQDAKFCQACGTNVPVETAPSAGQRFCTACGNALAPGQRFCNRCGRAVASLPAQGQALPPPPAAGAALPGKARWGRRVAIGTGVFVLLFAALAAYGSTLEEEEGQPDASGDSVNSGGAPATTPQPGVPTSRPPAGPTPRPTASIPRPTGRPNPVPTGVYALLDLANADDGAAKAVADALARAGVNMSGIEIGVFPMRNTAGSLLVIETADTAPAFAPGQTATMAQSRAYAQALLSAPAYSDVRHVAFHVRATDPRGPYVLTISLPISTVDGIAKGTLSDAAAQRTIKIATQRR